MLNTEGVSKEVEAFIASCTAARHINYGERVQELWSGYGEIRRVSLFRSGDLSGSGDSTGAGYSSVILKHVIFPSQQHHPRGWNSDFSHQRKLRSYQVEAAWYQHWAEQCHDDCRVPRCYGLQTTEQGMLLLLEDLDAAGWDQRYKQLDPASIKQCLRWLAAFHGRFLCQSPAYLWPVGSYWHLQTRPDEWRAMADHPLKNAAEHIDRQLNQARFQTVIHGDAKVANFCFSPALGRVSAVDFQYAGGGCGMKDVAYLLGSCLQQQQIDDSEEALLDYYFHALAQACPAAIDYSALEAEWRYLYPFAWADFHRFLLGWMPSHSKINRSMLRHSESVIRQLNQL